MAKTEAGGRSGGGWIPIAVAVLAIGLFFGWVATREPPESVAVAEPTDTAADTIAAGGAATRIQADVLTQSATARELIGQNVELQSVPVSDVLGSQMFWIELPGGSPFLVQMDSALVASGQALPQPGENVRVVGRVLDKTPEVMDRWMTTRVLEDTNQQILAEFGSTYIEAQRVEPAGS
jgi:hypothetical protein